MLCEASRFPQLVCYALVMLYLTWGRKKRISLYRSQNIKNKTKQKGMESHCLLTIHSGIKKVNIFVVCKNLAKICVKLCTIDLCSSTCVRSEEYSKCKII